MSAVVSNPRSEQGDDVPARDLFRAVELSFVMPFLKEAEKVAPSAAEALAVLAKAALDGEAIAADNGSTGGSQALAEAARWHY